jgi:hypothetical protein
MNGTCSQLRCHPDSGCILGETDTSKCGHWTAAAENPDIINPPVTRGSVPWSGSAFGLDDISLLSGRGRPRLIALIGPHNAGKTTYLAALHLLFIRRQLAPSLCFCGSMTLGGWERIADFMRYPKESGPCYPPHTPVSTERVPGMLHYAFRDDKDEVRDLLFTDAPGEWFSSWSIDPNPNVVPGATWTVQQADAFLFFIDREALGGPLRGISRHHIKTLAGRLSEQLKGRPIGIVWSKSDLSIDLEIKTAIEAIVNRCFPEATHFHTKFKPGGEEAGEIIDPLIRSFRFVAEQTKIANRLEINLQPHVVADSFLSYRGIRRAR